MFSFFNHQQDKPLVNVYVLNKDYETIKLNNLEKKEKFSKELLDYSSNNPQFITLVNKNFDCEISSVVEINNKMVKLITNSKEYLENEINYKFKLIFLKSEDITTIIFQQLKWRRATAYLTVQISSVGYRLICYVDDFINHNGDGFYTTLNLIDKSTIKDSFIKELPLLITRLLNYKKIYNNIDNIVDFIKKISPENFEQYFGF